MGLGAQTSKPSPRGHARPHRFSRIEPPLGKGSKGLTQRLCMSTCNAREFIPFDL